MSNKYIEIKNLKTLLILVLLVMLSVSCTKEKRSEVIIKEIENETIQTQNITTECNEYRYVINRRSGKVHTYSHGIEIIETPDNVIKTNENLDNILKNEKYDICLTCYAGLNLNLKKYKKKTNDSKVNKLIDEEIALIEKYMRLYEFGQLDTETQKFVICIFEVGNWYVNNVYTQLGGQKSALEINSIAADNASENAYKRWRDYLDKEYYSKYELRTEKRILPVVYDGKDSTDMVTYRCDLFKNAGYGKGDSVYSKTGMQILKNAEGEEIDKEWKNYCVIDDSSKFVAAVYYYYINKEILKNEKSENKTAYDIDLWGTNSEKYLTNNQFTNKLLKTKKFELHAWDDIKNNNQTNADQIEEFRLKIGDLLCRKGNVEFYIGRDKVVSWGRVHKTYTLNKSFYISNNGIISSDLEDKQQPHTNVIRFKGGTHGK